MWKDPSNVGGGIKRVGLNRGAKTLLRDYGDCRRFVVISAVYAERRLPTWNVLPDRFDAMTMQTDIKMDGEDGWRTVDPEKFARS